MEDGDVRITQKLEGSILAYAVLQKQARAFSIRHRKRDESHRYSLSMHMYLGTSVPPTHSNN